LALRCFGHAEIRLHWRVVGLDVDHALPRLFGRRDFAERKQRDPELDARRDVTGTRRDRGFVVLFRANELAELAKQATETRAQIGKVRTEGDRFFELERRFARKTAILIGLRD